MKPGGVVSLKRLHNFGFLYKNRLLILMAVTFVVGIIIGSLSVSRGGRAVSFASYFFNGFFSVRLRYDFLHLFLICALKAVLISLLYFIFGASVIGVVVSPLFCAASGVYFGGISAFIYSRYYLQGVAFNAVIFLPAALTFAICSFFAAKESFEFSSVLLKLTMPKSRPADISSQFKLYCGKTLCVTVFFIIYALIDAVVSVSFIKYFGFT